MQYGYNFFHVPISIVSVLLSESTDIGIYLVTEGYTLARYSEVSPASKPNGIDTCVVLEQTQ